MKTLVRSSTRYIILRAVYTKNTDLSTHLCVYAMYKDKGEYTPVMPNN